MRMRYSLTLTLSLALAGGAYFAAQARSEVPGAVPVPATTPDRTIETPVKVRVDPYPGTIGGKTSSKTKTPVEFHQAYDDAFASIADAFGVRRVVQLRVHGPDLVARTAATRMGGLEGRELSGLELLGLLDAAPLAYADPFKNVRPAELPNFPLPTREGARWVVATPPAVEVETRELDPFERDGLEALRRGETIVSSEDGLRMLGAVRARARCAGCHEVGEGDLVAAFSYSFRPVGGASGQ